MPMSYLGQPVVVNGIACPKIHHAAFDNHLIGIDPDGRVHVSERLLLLHDGPLPPSRASRPVWEQIRPPRGTQFGPDRDRLAARFEQFGRRVERGSPCNQLHAPSASGERGVTRPRHPVGLERRALPECPALLVSSNRIVHVLGDPLGSAAFTVSGLLLPTCGWESLSEPHQRARRRPGTPRHTGERLPRSYRPPRGSTGMVPLGPAPAAATRPRHVTGGASVVRWSRSRICWSRSTRRSMRGVQGHLAQPVDQAFDVLLVQRDALNDLAVDLELDGRPVTVRPTGSRPTTSPCWRQVMEQRPGLVARREREGYDRHCGRAGFE